MQNKTAVLIMGTFNPITTAHVALGSEAKKRLPEADVIYIPSNISFMKDWKNVDEGFLSDEERVELIKRAVEPLGFVVSDIEVSGVSNGRTYETVAYIKNSGYSEVYLCMGIDKLDELDRWYRADELFTENKVLVFERSGENLESCMTDFIKERREHFIAAAMEDDLEEVSSTKIREAFAEGRPETVRDIIPATIFNLLRDKNNILVDKE